MQRFKTSARDGAGLIRVAGPVTSATMRELRLEVLRLAMRSDVDRALFDLREAAMMLDQDEWGEFTRAGMSEHAVSVPTGYLITGPAIERVRAHCRELAMCGRVAVAFMTSGAAEAWLGVRLAEFPRVNAGVAPQGQRPR